MESPCRVDGNDCLVNGGACGDGYDRHLS
jgi:hypothetical protein